jgi:hypothetical protein
MYRLDIETSERKTPARTPCQRVRPKYVGTGCAMVWAGKAGYCSRRTRIVAPESELRRYPPNAPRAMVTRSPDLMRVPAFRCV